MSGVLGIEVDGRGVAVATLSRPEKHNALSRDLIDALTAAAADLGADPAVRVVVLRGAGRSFCAGGDLDWMRQQMQADAATRAREARALAHMLGALDALPKPLIGALHGRALGGGVGMACICDVAIASDETRFGLTEVRLGLIAATIGPYVVARIGAAGMRRVALSGRVFDAREAAALGIVSKVVPEDGLEAALEAEVSACLEAAPGAAAATKALARRLGGAPGEAEVEASIAALVETWEGAEAPEGVAAFFERREPPWRR